MTSLWILSLLLASQAAPKPAPKPASASASAEPVEALVRNVAESGRCVTVAETPSQRVSMKPRIAPGLPPLLSFRYYEGRMHHRYGNADLVLDDAGH